MKKALITGITGQDGSYLAELLLSKGYRVFGLRRKTSNNELPNLKQIFLSEQRKNLKLVYGDITDTSSILKAIMEINPDEVYNLAAQSHVHTSFQVPEYTSEVNSIGVVKMLNSLKISKKKIKFYQASSSEMFGNNKEKFQNESTPFLPVSPYGISKLFSHMMVENFRNSYDIFCSSGILFNHESPRRGKSFVTRKITNFVSKYKFNNKGKLTLGNLYSQRDWGHAKDYVKAMWNMLQADSPDDYVVATGKSYSIKFFVEKSFNQIGIDLIWEGAGKDEKGYNKINGKLIVEIDPYFYRPTELNFLKGNAKKFQKKFKWIPKINLDNLIDEMISSEITNSNE